MTTQEPGTTAAASLIRRPCRSRPTWPRLTEQYIEVDRRVKELEIELKEQKELKATDRARAGRAGSRPTGFRTRSSQTGETVYIRRDTYVSLVTGDDGGHDDAHDALRRNGLEYLVRDNVNSLTSYPRWYREKLKQEEEIPQDLLPYLNISDDIPGPGPAVGRTGGAAPTGRGGEAGKTGTPGPTEINREINRETPMKTIKEKTDARQRQGKPQQHPGQGQKGKPQQHPGQGRPGGGRDRAQSPRTSRPTGSSAGARKAWNTSMGVLVNNLRGDKLSERDLPRVTVPAQGNTVWTVPTTDGDKHFDEITGILVEYTNPRAYWSKPLEPGNVVPPDCSSPDGIKGFGEPGGDCLGCPFNVFGTALGEGQNGKACKEKKMLFLLQPDRTLPLVIQAPSTSLRSIRDYVVALGNIDVLPFHAVYTQLTLEKVGTGPMAYGKIVAKNVGPVEEEYIPQIEAYQKGFATILGAHVVDIVPDTEDTPTGEPDGALEGAVEGAVEGAAATA